MRLYDSISQSLSPLLLFQGLLEYCHRRPPLTNKRAKRGLWEFGVFLVVSFFNVFYPSGPCSRHLWSVRQLIPMLPSHRAFSRARARARGVFGTQRGPHGQWVDGIRLVDFPNISRGVKLGGLPILIHARRDIFRCSMLIHRKRPNTPGRSTMSTEGMPWSI